jgi:hypothetical protein
MLLRGNAKDAVRRDLTSPFEYLGVFDNGGSDLPMIIPDSTTNASYAKVLHRLH